MNHKSNTKKFLLILVFLIAFLSSAMLHPQAVKSAPIQERIETEIEFEHLKSSQIEMEIYGDPGEFTLELIVRQEIEYKSEKSWFIGTIHPKGSKIDTNVSFNDFLENDNQKTIQKWSIDLTGLEKQPLPELSKVTWSLHVSGNKTKIQTRDNIGFCYFSSFVLQWEGYNYESRQHPVFNQLGDFEIVIKGQDCELIDNDGKIRSGGSLFGQAGIVAIDYFYDTAFKDLAPYCSQRGVFIKETLEDIGGYDLIYAIDSETGHVTYLMATIVILNTASRADANNVKAMFFITTHGVINVLNPTEGLLVCWDTYWWNYGTYLPEYYILQPIINIATDAGEQVFWWQDTCNGDIFNFWDVSWVHNDLGIFWYHEGSEHGLADITDNPEYAYFRDYTLDYFDPIETIFSNVPSSSSILQVDTDSNLYHCAVMTTYGFIPSSYYEVEGRLVHFYLHVKVNYQARELEDIMMYVQGIYESWVLTDQNGIAHFYYTFSESGVYTIMARRAYGNSEVTYATAFISAS